MSCYNKVKSVDRPEAVPDAGLIRSILPANKPVLILLDEIVVYLAKLPEQARRGLLGFIGSLISEITACPQAVLVITDPAGQRAYHFETESLLDLAEQAEAAHELDEVFERKMSDFDPIGDESAQVIVRRLFDEVKNAAADEVSAEYFNAYKRVADDYPDLLPPEAASTDYAKRIVECYPFHPRLLESAQDRLQRVAAISPVAFTAVIPLLREAASTGLRNEGERRDQKKRKRSKQLDLRAGPFYPLNVDDGARVACFALIASGLRDGERLARAASHLRHADPNEAAWWLGLLTRDGNSRALRALRTPTEAVK